MVIEAFSQRTLRLESHLSGAEQTLNPNIKNMRAKKVFVSGCFDMLHSGHVRFLEAKQLFLCKFIFHLRGVGGFSSSC